MTKPTPKPIRERALTARGYAWKFRKLGAHGKLADDWILCCWAEPERDTKRLLFSKPTSDAVIIPVEIRSVPKRAKARRRKA